MWLIESDTEKAITKATVEGYTPSSEELVHFEAFSAASSEEAESRIMSIAGETAEIKIKGTLTNSPNMMAMLFGGGNTTYQEIISAINSAEQNDDIKNIVLAVDSPGGSVDGLFIATEAIASAKKHIRAVVSNMATSAAYALVAQADEIVAVNEATRVGSIGILARVKVDVSVVDITSTQAPKKAPDVTTEEGRDIVRESLDGLHDIFVATIAKGRDISTKAVNEDFGQGGTLLAREALNKKMIDSISNSVVKAVSAPVITDAFKNSDLDNTKASDNIKVQSNSSKKTIKQDKKGRSGMTVDELKAEDLALFNAVLAEGIKAGKATEKDRIQAHLTMGIESGDIKTAIKAIDDGSEMTSALNAVYLMASAKKASLGAIGDDSPDALNTEQGAEGSNAKDDEIIAGIFEDLGIVETVKAT